MFDVMSAINSEVSNKISNLTASAFENKSLEEIADKIFEEHKLITPVLDESKQFQREPKDVPIDIPTQSRFGGYATVNGTKFQIIVPFTGDRVLFNITPTTFSLNNPYASVVQNELHFTYEIPVGRDKSEVYDEYRRNVENIKSWLRNTDNDVNSFNTKLKSDILIVVTNRKKKIDDDKNAANSSGIPIR